jgi:hypothetical protein
MRRLRRAALGAVVLAGLAVGSVAAAKPQMFIVDVSTPEYEAEAEAFFLGQCGYPVEVDATGHVVVHVFVDHPRMIEIDNYRLFEQYSANGKTIVVRPDAGPDRIWLGRDGVPYLALVGRSVTGSGVIGRTVVNLATGDLVSSNGRELGDFIAIVCEGLAPAS